VASEVILIVCVPFVLSSEKENRRQNENCTKNVSATKFIEGLFQQGYKKGDISRRKLLSTTGGR
jgi:hypothetical protein